MDADVVIVAHNSGPLLAEAVASAISQASATNVWVVDAESTDGSVEAVRASGVNLIPVSNRGFSASNNRGIESGLAPFVLLLNPDAVLHPGSLETLVAAAEARPEVGIVGALVIDADGSVQPGSFGRFPSLLSEIGLRLRRAWKPLHRNSARSPKVPRSTRPVDWVTGAAMLVRRTAIAEVGPLDEGFFLYYEDVDWCHRMRAGGWQVLLEPAAIVTHHQGASGVPRGPVAQAYRASFYRYCDLHGLWGLRAASRLGLALRRLGEEHL